MLHKLLRTYQGGTDRAPNPENDAATLQNEQVVYVPNEKYRNPSRQAKHQRQLLKDYFNHVGGMGWTGLQDLRCGNQQSWGQKHLSVLSRTTVSPFQDYPIIPRIFIQAGVAHIFYKFPNKIQFISKSFKTISSQITTPLLKNFNLSYVKKTPY